MKKLLLVFLAFTAISSQASKDHASVAMDQSNTVSLEILGRGLLYSFNYDRAMDENWAIGAGFSYMGVSSGTISNSIVIIPVYGSYYFLPDNHRPYVTAGLNFVLGTISGAGLAGLGTSSYSGLGLIGNVGVGYEYRSNGGFVFRAAPYVFVGNTVNVWFGLSFGYAFG